MAREMVTGALSVVITGASAGVGRATALAFARRGWNIALIAREAEGLEDARREVAVAGARRVITLPLDVADAAAVEAAAERVARSFGGIDVWVNNAMATVVSPAAAMSPEEFRRVTEVTYLGQVHGTMAALRQMRQRDQGVIVAVGSALSYRAIPLQSAYCAAKFAVRGFMDSLRVELLHDRSRIRLTMVQLPAVNTPQFEWARNRMGKRAQPVPPIHQPEAVGEAIFAAAVQPKREVWLGWPTLKAILGGMAVPGLADRILARQGYSGQLTGEALPAGRQDNLFRPVAGPHRTRGRFSSRASSRVHAIEPALLRAVIGGAVLALPALAWMAGRRSGARRRIGS
ncbi:MAG: short-chain dehydrogenase [Azospirillum brasilense]|nr:MAG: short-chain dehydrogenase [Azospirillum brasilense]